MKPADFPLERLGALRQQFEALAAEEHKAARDAARLDRPAAQHGHAEAAFAYATAASQTNDTIQRIFADLDRAAAKEATPPSWPITGLVNVDDALELERRGDWATKQPRWGVPVEGRADNPYLAVGASARASDEILLWIFEKFTDNASHHMINVDLENWRALNRLVERIAARQPIPYNQAGDIHTDYPM